MATDPFLDEECRVLTPEAFDFMLQNELKRAMRSQNFLTLLAIQATPRAAHLDRAQVAREIARVISREVRETDLLSHTNDGRLSLVLLDADLDHSMTVVERLLARFEQYEFTTPAAISVGAACCPTHGADVESLRHAAATRPVHTGRERGSASHSQ
jgi:GGDEF domain-containing protein